MKTKLFKKFLFGFFLFTFFMNTIYATNKKEFIQVNVPAAVVIDYDTGRVLFGKNEEEQRSMASLTKVMTSILLVENCKMDEMIEVPSQATWIGGSTVGLKKGDKISAKSLLYGMMLPSGNDCAYTVGLHIGGTIENFAAMMTKKAQEIGVTDTSFANPHGLDDPNHYTTAKSMALITRYALKNKYINEAVQTKSITINFGSFSKLLNNTNALLKTYDKADGVKTGFTNGANRCLIASATDDGRRYITVVLGAETTNIRFSTAKTVLEECFSKYKPIDISKYLNFYINIPIIKGNKDSYEKQFSDNLILPLTEEEYEKIYVKQDTIQKIEAPMSAGTYIGNIQVILEDEILYEKSFYLEEDIYKKSVTDYIKDGIHNMFRTIERI
ncbi:MAG: D-alanyl-D-alanine carboxypeptidase [Clostridia bacterium]|nr:D-alanyl-D-alanine carboxypeptidase [Clostridia bacterium]